ncbi:Hypothetical protein BN2458_PEG1260 [Helicobacter typhlonius]|uniref:Uncharacterized protein n=1 Tax=Helicobacter typhlonius TaxID=76936 RepID=A0A0S4PVR8_9HELI|nr:Hypothetical protein BN2458_PEG1260 [Helicobacter typhlonius]
MRSFLKRHRPSGVVGGSIKVWLFRKYPVREELEGDNLPLR